MYGKSHPATKESVKIQQNNMATMDEIAMEGSHESLRPHTVDGSRIHSSLVTVMSSTKRAHTRRVWDKGSSGMGSPRMTSTLKSLPSTRNSQRAKYTSHHIPDPNSRCASSMVSYTFSIGLICGNDVHVTPSFCYSLHAGPPRSRRWPRDV